MNLKHKKNFLRKTQFLLVSTLLASMTSYVQAATTGPYAIKSVIVGGYGLHIEVSPTPTECTVSWEGTQFVILRTNTHFKELVSGVLSAQAQAKPIRLWHEPQGSGTCGYSHQLEVFAMQIKNL